MADAGRIWLTRPQEDSEALANALSAHSIPTLIAPIMQIEPITPIMPDQQPDALLLTSRHACHLLPTLPKHWHGLRVFCIGSATAHAAEAAGFTHVAAGSGDILDLLPLITRELQPGARILYFSGEDTRRDAVALLAGKGIEAQQLVAYKAHAITQLPEAVADALHHGLLTAVVFFSPRSAAIAGELLKQQGLEHSVKACDAYCLSLAVAEAAGAQPWKKLKVSHQPTRDAMLDLLVSHHAVRVL